MLPHRRAARSSCCPPAGQPWTASPRFATRGLLPWPDFLNCITVFNDEDFRAYFEAMLRMRFNTFGMHVYTRRGHRTESYLSLRIRGRGPQRVSGQLRQRAAGATCRSARRSYGMGAAGFYDAEVFGSDATRLARDPWETAERTREMLRKAFAYAAKLGIRTGIGFEPYQVPDEIVRALPPEAKPPVPAPGVTRPPGPRFLLDSVAGRDLLETRLGQLLEAYPEVDYVWLWEDESMNWASRQKPRPAPSRRTCSSPSRRSCRPTISSSATRPRSGWCFPAGAAWRATSRCSTRSCPRRSSSPA